MFNWLGQRRLHCPSCRVPLGDEEVRVGVCDECGRVFDPAEPPEKDRVLCRKDAADRGAVLAER